MLIHCPAPYLVLTDAGDFIDGIGCETLDDAIVTAKDVMINWESEKMSNWKWEAGKPLPSPTPEQIEEWDSMIENCGCYIVEWDYEEKEYPSGDYAVWPSDIDLDSIGWKPWDELQKGV